MDGSDVNVKAVAKPEDGLAHDGNRQLHQELIERVAMPTAEMSPRIARSTYASPIPSREDRIGTMVSMIVRVQGSTASSPV